jgi:recombinational DNA repair ATPase RecF
MEYSKMLCWLSPQEREKFISVVASRIPVVFVENCDDFKKEIIEKNTYIVLSIADAKLHLIELQKLLREFCHYRFHFMNRLDGEGCSYEEFEILDEENAVSIPYDIEELVLEATGKIDNIFQKRGISERRH